ASVTRRIMGVPPVWLKYCAASRGLSMIVVQQPSKTFSTYHCTMLTPYSRLWDNKLVPKTLVISLVMVIDQVRLEDVEKRRLSHHDHLIEGFLFDGTNKSLAMGVEIWAPWGQNNRLHSAAPQQCIERWRKFGVPVVDQVAPA